jgi:hypothetical protein
MVSVRHLSLHSVARLFFSFIPFPLTLISSFLVTSKRYLFFFFSFFIAVSSRFATIYSAHGGVLRPFSTPLTTQHPLCPLAPLNVCHLPSPHRPPPFPPLSLRRSRTDTTTESSFIPEPALLGCRALPVFHPPFLVERARSLAISYRHPCATLRR